ncbi:MAG: hypothetical protein R3F29_06770 [Planctomycetota bacterium]
MSRLAWALCLIPLFLSAESSLAQQEPEIEVPRSQLGILVDRVVAVDGEGYRYAVWLPPGYADDETRRWPLMVFLNGLGECGRDGKKQARVGLGAALNKQPERWPFVIAFPQKPIGSTQWGDHEDLLLAVMAETEKDYRTDQKRRYLTGLSQGGSGAWQFGSQLADRWSAVAPICGYRLGTWNVEGLRDKPVWAFHGTADPVVPMRASKMLCAELEKAGGHPVLTLYEGVQHNSWDRAYQESALAEWFRIVVDEPLGARYLADHAAVREVHLLVTVEAAPDDDGPWGTRVFKLDAKERDLSWSFFREWRGSGDKPVEVNGDFTAAVHAEEGDWKGAAADRLVWPTLQDLVWCGVCDPQPTPSVPERARVKVLLSVQGEHGVWMQTAGFGVDGVARNRALLAFGDIVKRGRGAAAASEGR